MDILLQDLRFAVRGLLHRPVFTLVATITLALGIGANTAIFSVVNAVIIRPVPYAHPEQLVAINGVQGDQGGQGVSYADYVDWRQQNRAFADIGAYRPQSFNLTGGDTPDRLIGSYASASFLRILGVALSRGRAFTEAETDLATQRPVALVSSEAWRARFGSDPAMLGKTLVLNGTAFTVVGIMAPGSMPLVMGGASPPEVVVPIGFYPNAHGLDRGTRGVGVFGRMRPGVSRDAAAYDLAAIEHRLADAYPTTNAGTGAEVLPLKDLFFDSRIKGTLIVVLAAVVVVLLIACANVANLQLARGASRARELSVRAALGAGRRRIAQQLLTESVVLSLAGGGLGIALAAAFTKGLRTFLGGSLPIDPASIAIDGPVLAFALGISVATGILFGLPPAWKTSRVDLADMLRVRAGGALGHLTTRNTLAVAQLALSLALLASAGLLTRSLIALQHVDPGFDADHLLTAQFRLSANKYDSPQKIWAMFDRTIAEIRAVPGVESAALVRSSPLSGNGDQYQATIEGRAPAKAADAPSVVVNPVTTRYFATMRIPILLGRDVAETDRGGTLPVVVVSKRFADRAWPNESPLDKRVKFGDDDWRVVVGVGGDARQYSLGESPTLEAYIPHAQRPEIFTSLVVRAKGNPLDLVKPVRDAIWRVDRDQPVWRFRSMDEDLVGSVSAPRATMWLMGLFAVLALTLAAVGIYGVLSYTTAQRTQEIGIRIALGADAGQVARMVVGEGMRLVVAAVGIGLVASLGAARLLRSQLFGVGPHDMVTFGVVTVVLSGVAALACYIPARRASRIDPMVALRSE